MQASSVLHKIEAKASPIEIVLFDAKINQKIGYYTDYLLNYWDPSEKKSRHFASIFLVWIQA